MTTLTIGEARTNPRELTVSITSNSGRSFRWGYDDPKAQNVPAGLAINTQIPGGFASMTCTLSRRPDLPYADLDEFAPCTVYGLGGSQVAFDGYLSARPLSRQTNLSQFSPNAVGWASHMTDELFSMVYIDRQLSAWQGPSTGRQQVLISVGAAPMGYTLSTAFDGGGNPALELTTIGQIQGGTQKQYGEASYDAGANNKIARFQATNFLWYTYGGGDTNVITTIATTPNDLVSSFTSFNQPTGTTTPYAFNATADRFVSVEHEYNFAGAAGAAGVTYGVSFWNPAVIGNHGLTLYAGPSGNSPGSDDGFHGGDIIRDIIGRACPLLTANGIVVDTFVVDQMVFNQPTTADDAVQQVNQFYLYDYGVYESQDFFWRPPGTGRTWQLRIGDDGVTMQDQGPQIETAFNQVIVQFADAAGVTRFVGPPGFGGDATSTALEDTSSTNPVNAYGRTRASLVQMSSTSTSAAAIQVGQQFLEVTNSRPSSGSATVVGAARDSTGRNWPAWMIRAGDTVIFVDTNDQTPRYVLSTAYDHDSLTNSLTLDAPPDRMDWILARLGLSISAID